MGIISKLQKGIHDGIFWVADKTGNFLGDHILRQASENATGYAMVKAAPFVLLGMKFSFIIVGIGFILICFGMPKTAIKCIGVGSLSYILLSLL
ncbi:hypothetical protein CN514_00780 [Bacillus sp. AFS001701]|uniref:hypothetical protein n=1 Tax=Bacillus sp. AFS001701 TaxID=2033480 RepID=UPI000BF57499|nr:hypothetical protein [Bacillus sp. AFS001701]PET77565.1 hypothetical protein CN514_00780 [Bacillus sp. AFS001701]